MLNRDDLYFELLDMLEFTSPSPSEIYLMEPFLPVGGEWVKENYIYTIGNSSTLFACHIDTVGQQPMKTNVRYDNGRLFTGNKDVRCLGGDDRCGMLCLKALIDAGVPGTYVFHTAEERGAISASDLSDSYDFTRFNRAIEFDRRGTNSIITQMSGDVVCSDYFAEALASELGIGYRSDPTGLFTDVYLYKYLVPEVTNLSVGYMHEHQNKEEIEVLWLIDDLIPAIIKVNWESLPINRDHKKAEKDNERMFLRSRFGKKKSGPVSAYFINDSKADLFDTQDGYDAFGTCDKCGNTDFVMYIDKVMLCDDCLDDDDDIIDSCDFCGDTNFITKHTSSLGDSYSICSSCAEIVENLDSEDKSEDLQ